MRPLRLFIPFLFLSAALADVFSDLGITKTDAQDYLVNALTGGYFGFPGTCRKVPLDQRPAVVKAIGAFAQAYVNTDDFKTRYTAWREEHKPKLETKTWAQYQQELKVQAVEMRKGIAGSRAAFKNLDAATRKQLEPALAQQEQMAKDLEAGKGAMVLSRETFELINKSSEEAHRASLQQWETDYPADPNVLLRQRLERFLELSAEVDFAAKTVALPNGNRRRFANPDYEQKPSTWKQCYRAGKPAVDAARALAQEWLAGL